MTYLELTNKEAKVLMQELGRISREISESTQFMIGDIFTQMMEEREQAIDNILYKLIEERI